MTGPITRPRRIDRWIPWMFPAGFLLVFAVNGLMVWIALATYPGIAVDHPYDRGRTYDRVIAAGRAQAELGWRVRLETSGEPARLALRLIVTGPDGAPVPGLRLRDARLVSPVDPTPDHVLSFRPETNGALAAIALLPRGGQWELRADLEGRDGVFRLVRRIQVF